MKQTETIRYIINELKEKSLITYNKDFLSYIGITTDSTHIKRLSSYIRRSGSIHDRAFLKAIENKFHFESSIWLGGDEYQKKCIDQAIDNKVSLELLPGKEALDISKFLDTKYSINKKHLELLDTFSKLTDKHKEEAMIDHFLSIGVLEKKVENQEFLVKLLKLTYQKGLYVITVEFILPNLYRHYYLLEEVQKIEAHTRGSLGEYNEAKYILNILIHKNIIENINLRTSALSNHKREIFHINSTIDTDQLYTLIEGYQELHAVEGTYSYYTGINLLYLVILGQIIFPQEKRYQIDTEMIYKLSKQSLQEDKTHDKYYATMSNFEFKLLLGYKNIPVKIETFLSIDEPHFSLVERTLRQMKLFSIKTREVKNYLTNTISEIIWMLESYINQFSKSSSR